MQQGAWEVPKNVVVTGGTGFVGTHVCRELAKNGENVIAAGIEPFSAKGLFLLGELGAQVKFVKCDVCDSAALEALCKDNKVDGIIHIAGYVGYTASMRDPARTYAVNIGGTVNVLEAARKNGVRKVVIISSNAAYSTKIRPAFDESHPVTSIFNGNPNSHYGTSKMAGEQIGLAYYSFHDMDVVAARITGAYGFLMAGGTFIGPLVDAAVAGDTLEIPSGASVARDYTYVADTAAGIVAMLNTDTRKLEQRVYNISRGQLVAASDVAALVRKYVPGAKVSVGDALDPWEEINVKQRAPLNSEAAQRTFGFEARHSLEDGVKAYVEMSQKFLQSEAA